VRKRNVEHAPFLALVVAVGTVWYWGLFDDAVFSSSTVATYALSQSIQLTGPIIMGFAAVIGRRHALEPIGDLVRSSARGSGSMTTAVVVRISLAAIAGYVLGCVVVALVTLQSHFINGFSLRVLAPPIEVFALIMVGYVLGRLIPRRLTAALVAVGGYFLMTEPHYLSQRWVQLAHVQQARFTAWETASAWSGLPFLVWMLALSAMALALPTAFSRWPSAFVLAVASAVALACVVSLYSAQWGDMQREFRVVGDVALSCDEGPLTCVHPAYVDAQPSFREVSAAANTRLERIGIGPLVYAQVPEPGSPSVGDVGVDVFTDSPLGLQVGVSEGVNAWLRSQCSSPSLPPPALGPLASWVAGLFDDTAVLEQLRNDFGLNVHKVDDLRGRISC